MQARAAAQLGRLQDFADDLGAIRVRTSSDDGLVTVESDAAGSMTGLWLDEGVGVLDGRRLGEVIVATATVAAQQAFAQRAAATDDFTASFTELVHPPPAGDG